METVYRPDGSLRNFHKCSYDKNEWVSVPSVILHEVQKCDCGRHWTARKIAGVDTYSYVKMVPLKWWHKAYWKIDRSEA